MKKQKAHKKHLRTKQSVCHLDPKSPSAARTQHSVCHSEAGLWPKDLSSSASQESPEAIAAANARDQKLINRAAKRLNREAQDVLTYQSLDDLV